jgi:hypothetical protein
MCLSIPMKQTEFMLRNVVKHSQTIQVTIKMMTTKVKLILMKMRTSMIGCCYAELTKIMVKQVIGCQTMKQWICLKR